MEADPARPLASSPPLDLPDEALVELELSRAWALQRVRMLTLSAVAGLVAVMLAGALGAAVYLLAGSLL